MTAVTVLAAEKFWILDPLYQALGTLVAWFYSVVPSYGVAIALLTLAVRIITLPLTAKQARSQQQMQRLAPELKRLQAKYKHDKQKLNEEMMKFYKENHANPFGGCLPVLVQAPVLIVLYRLILGLSARPEPKHIPESTAMFAALKESGGTMLSWGIDLAQAPAKVVGAEKFPYLVLVALVVATGYYQQRQLTARVSRENINPQMAMMTKVFPVMFGFFSFVTPAGVVVYFLVSNIWQIGQQAFLFRNQPAPETTGTAKGKDRTAKGKDRTAKDKDRTAKDKDRTAKDGKPVAGSKGKLAAGPPTKAKTTGAKGGAKGGAARGPAKGGTPARSSSGKGSGKGTPGNRPSGRVTSPKQRPSGGKTTPTAKGAASGAPRGSARAGGDDTESAGEKQRWWQRLRPAASATPNPSTSGRTKPATGAMGPKGGGARGARPQPNTGKAKQTPTRTNQPKATRPGREVGPTGSGPGDGARPGAATAPQDVSPSRGTTGDSAPSGGFENGQAHGSSGKADATSPLVTGSPLATNGSGDDRTKSDNSGPTSGDSTPEAAAGDSGASTGSVDETQKGDE